MVEPDPNNSGLGRCHSPLTVTLSVYNAGRRMVAARWFLEGTVNRCRPTPLWRDGCAPCVRGTPRVRGASRRPLLGRSRLPSFGRARRKQVGPVYASEVITPLRPGVNTRARRPDCLEMEDGVVMRGLDGARPTSLRDGRCSWLNPTDLGRRRPRTRTFHAVYLSSGCARRGWFSPSTRPSSSLPGRGHPPRATRRPTVATGLWSAARGGGLPEHGDSCRRISGQPRTPRPEAPGLGQASPALCRRRQDIQSELPCCLLAE